MTLTSVLKALPEFVLAELNLSSASTPTLLLKSLAHHCEVVKGNGDHVLFSCLLVSFPLPQVSCLSDDHAAKASWQVAGHVLGRD